ncbi:MAG: response regulator [Candidatus Thiodiazotropha sp.]
MNQWETDVDLEQVLIIDDQSVGHEQLQYLLQGQYRVSWVSREQADHAHIVRHAPNLILLDVDPPAEDGRQFCRALKADPMTSVIPVIFISSEADPGDRLAGFHAGADDYVERPYNPEDLLLKIRIALNNRHDLEDSRFCQTLLRKEMEESLSVSSELGEMARFFIELRDCDNIRLLGERVLAMFERLGLRVIVRMLPGGHYFSHAGEVGGLDREIMSRHPGKEWFHDFGHRTLISAGSLCVLIRNMPVHDTMRHLHLKESLKLLVGVVGRRLACMQQRPENDREEESLRPLIAGIHQLIEHLQSADNGVRHHHTPHHLNRLFRAWESCASC